MELKQVLRPPPELVGKLPKAQSRRHHEMPEHQEEGQRTVDEVVGVR